MKLKGVVRDAHYMLSKNSRYEGQAITLTVGFLLGWFFLPIIGLHSPDNKLSFVATRLWSAIFYSTALASLFGDALENTYNDDYYD